MRWRSASAWAIQNSKCKMQNEVAAPSDIVERTIDYSLRAIRLYRQLEADPAGRILGRQFLRSATSVGANVHEAQATQSTADFVAKMSIAHKEIIETRYWLELLARAEILPAARLEALQDETNQLSRILASILIKSKQPNNGR